MIKIDDADRVRLITFDRPEARNAFNTALYNAVADALAEAQERNDIAVVVLTGEGTSYSAGQDLAEMGRLGDPTTRAETAGERAGHGFQRFVGTLEALTSSIDAKDPYTRGHSERVAGLSAALAEAAGLNEEQVERVRLAGIVHDVGKIGVPEAVLCKTGRLTDEEFALIRQHPEIGYQILRDIPQFEDLLPGVLSHHERFDGTGYPHGLTGDAIPLMARIIGLVDAFDAMSSNRTYRSAMPRDRVFEELADHAGSQFDPDLVEAFRRVDLARYDELVERHQAEDSADTTGAGGFLLRRSASHHHPVHRDHSGRALGETRREGGLAA